MVSISKIQYIDKMVDHNILSKPRKPRKGGKAIICDKDEFTVFNFPYNHQRLLRT